MRVRLGGKRQRVRVAEGRVVDEAEQPLALERVKTWRRWCDVLATAAELKKAEPVMRATEVRK
jgi:hypothetical protein